MRDGRDVAASFKGRYRPENAKKAVAYGASRWANDTSITMEWSNHPQVFVVRSVGLVIVRLVEWYTHMYACMHMYIFIAVHMLDMLVSDCAQTPTYACTPASFLLCPSISMATASSYMHCIILYALHLT